MTTVFLIDICINIIYAYEWLTGGVKTPKKLN